MWPPIPVYALSVHADNEKVMREEQRRDVLKGLETVFDEESIFRCTVEVIVQTRYGKVCLMCPNGYTGTCRQTCFSMGGNQFVQC
jgi:hypothetical protein